MKRVQISSGSPFEEVAGYSRAIKDGHWVFVSGTSGYKDGEISEDVTEQARQSLATIELALKQADSSFSDVVRLRVYVTKAEYFQTIAPLLGAAFQGIRPANTTIVCGLVDPKMKVEIEVTAKKSGKCRPRFPKIMLFSHINMIKKDKK